LKVVFRKFIADESGATAIEYGLIAAGIAIAIITAVNGVGTKLSSNFDTIKTKLTP
jgi:pilus assembly protein Flp/PilA